MNVRNHHYTTARRIAVVDPVVQAGDDLEVSAEFEKDGAVLKGAELYVVAQLRKDNQLVAAFPLLDRGGADEGRFVGKYRLGTADPKGQYRLRVFAQDVNQAHPHDPADVAAKSIGGIFVSIPDCTGADLAADATVEVR
jgi:hypothetical protein